jgi:hypothetical protein
MSVGASPILGANQGEARTLLNDLNGILSISQTEVEFYFMGGAVLYQAFNASPRTAQISDMFRRSAVVQDAAEELARGATVPDDWLQGSVRSVLAGAAPLGSYLELSHLSVFVPLPAYVLAVKCAAMRLEDDFHELEDVRYVLRAMNITSADQAMTVVGHYFAERQLMPSTRGTLAKLLDV